MSVGVSTFSVITGAATTMTIQYTRCRLPCQSVALTTSINQECFVINDFQHYFFFSELVSGSVETIGEEKARKVLDRVDFLSKLREEVVALPDLKEKLENLAEMALDLPEWWIPGKHDHDLVVGAAR